MSHNHLWMFNKKIVLSSNISSSVIKIASIEDVLFILTSDNCLFKGKVETNETESILNLEPAIDMKIKDIGAAKECLYIVDAEGRVFLCNKELEIVEELEFIEESNCPRGHKGIKRKVKIKCLAVGEYGQLFISNDHQLWGCGYMLPVEISSDTPKVVNFFSGRKIYDISVGADFAVIVTSKKNFEDELSLEYIYNCPNCIANSQTTTPDSQVSMKDICPLGIKIKNNSSFELSNNDNPSSEHLNENGLDTEKFTKVEKNIIFRNTEAAKEFLTRQISRMSSVGEEYLIECTEKPTRLIKENVSNMASFVYEGVKTVGDKVATLSRHVSTSSEYNGELENNNVHGVHRKGSKDEFLISGSQSTSEKDLSEVEVQDQLACLIKSGMDLLNREVWSWGNIFHGILGNSENKKRRPVIMTILSNHGVCKVSLQNHHASALTLDGRVFVWGQNNYNQVTLDNHVDQMTPKLFACNIDERVRDAICGNHFTVILTNKSSLIYFGKGVETYQNMFNKFMMDYSEEGLAINLFRQVLSANQFTLLNLESKCDEYVSIFLYKEQTILEELLYVYHYLIKPLMKETSDSSNDILYDSLCKYYTDLLYFQSVIVKNLLEYRNGLIPQNEIVLLKHHKEYISLYKSYIDVIHNVTSINGFEQISKLVNISPTLYKLKSKVLKEKHCEVKDMSIILSSPFKRLHTYTEFFKNYASTDTFRQWKEFVDYSDIKAKEAEKTNSFWLNSGKNIDYLINPTRRIICDSQTDQINLFNSSRFSSHRFVLFSDILAHINGSSLNSSHRLTMIWLDLPHNENVHLITLKVPEDTITLVTKDSVLKNKWFHVLQHSIKTALNKNDLVQPPLARTGSYTFTKTGFFQDAMYTGRWLNAKMHGSGQLKWPDGRVYTGSFNNNILSGYGTMEIPGKGFYEGYWKDNKQNGYGTFTCCNGNIYKGYFKDGLEHGHGFLRQGSFTANSASVYIGEWCNGQKCGYGVMDEISAGQKYMGFWLDNQKEGNGLIVTVDDIYYEGNFHNDALLGTGTMILNDGSCYEGEFKGTGIFGGKGSFTLPSGYVLEGNLSGSLDTGLKINSAILTKPPDTKTNVSKSARSNVSSDQKWKALFKHCFEALGLPDDNGTNGSAETTETKKIWQNVAVYLSNASTLKRTKGGEENSLQNSLNQLDVIPPFGRDKLTMESYQEIKNYLARAFESNFHPLGSLLESLYEAYIASYSGKIHAILVNDAISEIINITSRVYDVIRHLFPALPVYQTEYIVYDTDKEETVSCQSLLYPVILPKVYNCLFTLLNVKINSQENQYKKALKELNKLPDRNLMKNLSVEKKFFDLDYSSVSTDNCAFSEAIETLQQIKSMFLPIEKLIVIRNTVNKMTPVAQSLIGEDYVWNMDDLFPLFLYVVVRARIPDLGSELEFIDNFMDSTIESGELDIMFTTLKACYQQILQDKSLY